MSDVNIDSVVRVCQDFVTRNLGRSLPTDALADAVRSALLEPKHMMKKHARRIVTRDEVARMVAFHVHSLVQKTWGFDWDQDWGSWPGEIEHAIFEP